MIDYKELIRETLGKDDEGNTFNLDAQSLALAAWRKMVFMETNRWLRANNMIQKFKSKRSLPQYLTTGYSKIIANLMELILKKCFDGLPTEQLIITKEPSWTRVTALLHFDMSGYSHQLPRDHVSVANRNAKRLLVDDFSARTTKIRFVNNNTINQRGYASLQISFEALDLMKIQAERYTFEDLIALLLAFRTDVVGLPPIVILAANAAIAEETEEVEGERVAENGDTREDNN